MTTDHALAPSDRSPSAPGIVVGYDASPGAQLALEWAVETARRDDRDLTIVHALGLTVAATVSAYDPGPAARLYEEMTEGVLRTAAARAGTELDPARVHSVSVIGSPSAELVEASRHADLLVTGSRGHGEAHAGLLGSTAYAVIAHAACPVVVVRGAQSVHAGPSAPVVVAVDESDEAQRALALAVTTAAAAEAPLHVVGVTELPPPTAMWAADPAPGYGAVVPPAWIDDMSEELRAATVALVDDAVASVRQEHAGADLVPVVLEGAPGREVARYATKVGAGLVVVGSRGRGGFVGMLLGSVSHRVVHDATCPVLVVR